MFRILRSDRERSTLWRLAGRSVYLFWNLFTNKSVFRDSLEVLLAMVNHSRQKYAFVVWFESPSSNCFYKAVVWRCDVEKVLKNFAEFCRKKLWQNFKEYLYEKSSPDELLAKIILWVNRNVTTIIATSQFCIDFIFIKNRICSYPQNFTLLCTATVVVR